MKSMFVIASVLLVLFISLARLALEELNKANQNDPFIQCMIGQTYEKLAEKDKAIEYYRKAPTASSRNPPGGTALSHDRAWAVKGSISASSKSS